MWDLLVTRPTTLMPIGLSSPDGTTVYFSADEAEHIGFLRGPLEIGALESEGASFLVPIVLS